MTANELKQMHQGALRDLAKSLGVKVGRMTREQMAAATVAHRAGTRPDPHAARRRVLATIATEAPGQDVAGVVVIDDALRIDFVSGAALLVGADGTLSWERPG